MTNTVVIARPRPKYGLMRDCAKPDEIDKNGVAWTFLQHRFAMTAAMVELGLSGFGITLPKGWVECV